MPNPNFALNLRSLCNRHRSVAHVCRSLEMNRQQFNKYLSGQIYPSRHNLGRICKFFKLSEEQLNLAPKLFEQVSEEDDRAENDYSQSFVDLAIHSLPNSIELMSRYEGYYYSHFHSLGFPGNVIRSLVRIYRHEDRFYTNCIEHLWDKGKPEQRKYRFKYKGLAMYLGDRLFITEYEVLTKTVVSNTILFPSYRNVIDTLSGLSIGVGSISARLPKATRVEYQFLGKEIDKREALNGCGLFQLDNQLINERIRERINNEINEHEFMLSARDY